MEERHNVKIGQHVALSCFSLKDYRANFVYKIVCVLCVCTYTGACEHMCVFLEAHVCVHAHTVHACIW